MRSTTRFMIYVTILAACVLWYTSRASASKTYDDLRHTCPKTLDIPGRGYFRNLPLKKGAPAYKENEVLFKEYMDVDARGVDNETQEILNQIQRQSDLQEDNPSKRKLSVLDPLFNIREMVKNLLLLEQHLFVPEHRCVQCIRKHTMLIEAFLDEAYSLDESHGYTQLLKDSRTALSDVTDKVCDLSHDKSETLYREIGQDVRAMRKPLVQTLFQNL